MARYTDTQEKAFSNLRDTRAIIVDGTITIESYDGVAWIVNDTLVSGTYELFTKGLQLRFTITSGNSYWIEEGINQ